MTADPADHGADRLSAIDAVRGPATVIMAIDHVRDFFLVAAVKARRRDWWRSYG